MEQVWSRCGAGGARAQHNKKVRFNNHSPPLPQPGCVDAGMKAHAAQGASAEGGGRPRGRSQGRPVKGVEREAQLDLS